MLGISGRARPHPPPVPLDEAARAPHPARRRTRRRLAKRGQGPRSLWGAQEAHRGRWRQRRRRAQEEGEEAMSFPSPSLSRSSSKARPALCAPLCRVYIDLPTRTVGRGVPLPRLPVKCSQEPVGGRAGRPARRTSGRRARRLWYREAHCTNTVRYHILSCRAHVDRLDPAFHPHRYPHHTLSVLKPARRRPPSLAPRTCTRARRRAHN